MSLLAPVGLAILLLTLPMLLQPRNSSEMGEFRGFMGLLWRLNATYCRLVHRLQTNQAPLPGQGAAILIANHTCNIDHFLLQAGTFRKLGFMIAKEYYDFPPFRPFCRLIGCIPVNRNGKDLAATRAALRALEEGRVVTMFPEGKIIPKSGEEIGEGKHGVAFLALRAKVPVIPAYIRGTPRSNEFRQSFFMPSHARVMYGPAIDPAEYLPPDGHPVDERVLLTATTDRFMAAISALRDCTVAASKSCPHHRFLLTFGVGTRLSISLTDHRYHSAMQVA